MKYLIVFAFFITSTICLKIPKEINKLTPKFSNGRIINGEEAKKHAAPYIVSLTTTPTGSHFCAGSLISREYILTAAHCVGSSRIYATAGLHDRNVKSDGQTVKVAKSIAHERYTGGVGPYDIALLKLEKPMQLDSVKVKTVKLRTNEEVHGLRGTIYGWGKDSPWGGLPNKLQTVKTNIINKDVCKSQLPAGAPIAEGNICSASNGTNGISACNGDSGGPFVYESTRKHTILVGLVSWGYVPCGVAGYPSVYTDVAYFDDWIIKNMN